MAVGTTGFQWGKYVVSVSEPSCRCTTKRGSWNVYLKLEKGRGKIKDINSSVPGFFSGGAAGASPTGRRTGRRLD